MLTDDKWQFWIDRGGTFTDIVAEDPHGRICSLKLLSENPERYRDAAIQGIRDILNISGDTPLPVDEIAAVKMGTTVATNALLERRGERTLLVITKGFGDALRIGYQNRPDLFAVDVTLPDLLYQQVIEVDERVDTRGNILETMDVPRLKSGLKAAFDKGIRAVAVVCIHGYRYPDTEQKIGAMARAIGFSQISLSHLTSPLMKLISRGDTTVIDACLSPLLRRYKCRIEKAVKNVPLYFMQSSGGLVSGDHFHGKDAILSGPAGGIVGAVKVAEAAGYDRLITFDMGGTSTDVSHYRGEFERRHETSLAGVRIRVPMMSIHTVAAGGGSILSFRDGRFRVGPESAGANPGPAGYRRGGPLSVTDCNILLGRINPDFFPKIFGPEGDQPLDRDIVTRKFHQIADQMALAGCPAPSLEYIAEGFLMIAVENMAAAIRKISVQKGHDISGYTLVSFGGAGGQHACKLADRLGIKRIFLHPLAGVLSAYGIGLADLRSIKQQAIEQELTPESLTDIEDIAEALSRTARQDLIDQNVREVKLISKLHLKYSGSDTTLQVTLKDMAGLKKQFDRQHRQQFGFISPEKSLIVEQITVEACGGGRDAGINFDRGNSDPELPEVTSRIYSNGASHPCPVIHRNRMTVARQIKGPAIIVENHGTNILEAGWRARLDPQLNLVLERTETLEKIPATGTEADPVMLEIFNSLFMSIAEQMGAVLEKVARSVNMKERLDFSCALFDGGGNLVANAPHMPVHLGSMGASVKRIITANRGQMRPGDSFLLNDPCHGGTHLPDMTVVSPYFRPKGEKPLFYVASRGHHADIGGITPGSMPPLSRIIDEEGILFDNFPLVKENVFQEQSLGQKLAHGSFPARNPARNIADLKAQLAAIEKGRQQLDHMVDEFTLPVALAYMSHVQDNAEEAVRRTIRQLPSGRYDYPLDNGACIRVSITINRKNRSATVDFTGTSPQLDSNFNAPAAITRAAVLYVFRCLVKEDIPLNEGCLKPIDIIIPEGTMLNPRPPAAVAAGNVETSQAIVNALFLALDVMAAAQGTMNNFTFGNDDMQYYETIAGGMGASHHNNGATAIQSHMTNSRLTDPEVLESRYPVTVEKFEIRTGSGGRGKYNGGDGLIRHIRFKKPMTAAIISGHRTLPPPGLGGGEAGKCGLNQILRADGRLEALSFADETHMQPDDVFIIETPGGGAVGKKR